MNNKRMLTEIDSWLTEGIVCEDCAEKLRGKYSAKRSGNTFAIVLSVIGSLLIGAGIVLIFAMNWYSLPISVKTVLSFLPLIIGQGLAVFTYIKKNDSVVWREGVSVFWCAGVFAALAMIGQSFHLANDFSVYILTCGLLCMPIMFVLKSVSPLLVYYYTVYNWGILMLSEAGKPIFLLLLLLLLLPGFFVTFLLRKKPNSVAYKYSLWLSVIAALVYIGIFGYATGMVFILFAPVAVIMLAVDHRRHSNYSPFRILGLPVGAFILLSHAFGLTYDNYMYDEPYASAIVISVLAIAAALVLLVRNCISAKTEKPAIDDIIFSGSLIAMSIINEIAMVMLDGDIDEFVLLAIAVICVVASSIGLIYHGSGKGTMLDFNVGLIMAFALFVFYFFTADFSLVTRGVVFVIMGVILLAVNSRMLKKKKLAVSDNNGEEIE